MNVDDKSLNHTAWAQSMIGFIRSRGLESELKDYCGGWPCPVASGETASCGYSSNGVNVWGNKDSIVAVSTAFHSHGQIEELRRNLRHWREECGKLHAQRDALLQAHQMEVRVLYEALERALSHFAVMGTDQAKLAAEEIDAVLRR